MKTKWIQEVIRLAAFGPVDARILSLAAEEVVSIEETPEPDRRRVATLRRARRVAALRAEGVPRCEICERLSISISQYERALATHRESRWA